MYPHNAFLTTPPAAIGSRTRAARVRCSFSFLLIGFFFWKIVEFSTLITNKTSFLNSLFQSLIPKSLEKIRWLLVQLQYIAFFHSVALD